MSKTIFRSRTIQAFIVGALLLSLLFAACAPPIVDADRKPPAGSPTHEGIDIADVDILIMESFPVQVAVIVRGHLRDGCTEIDAIRQSFDPDTDTFSINITTVRDDDALCTLALVPFEEQVSLNAGPLPAGTYTVNVNGITDSFTLDRQTAPPADDDEPAPSPDPSVTYGTADVEEIQVRIRESDPVQVAVDIRGYLRDGCTEVHAIRQRFDAATDTFYVDIATARPTDAICILVLQELEERVTLDVAGLPGGTYTVDVNGVTDTFTLDG